jgi:hypothetical protein
MFCLYIFDCQKINKPCKKMKNLVNTIAFFGLVILLQSCSYSIIVSNKNGVPKPDPLNEEMGFYNSKAVERIDSVIILKVLENEVSANINCSDGGFHSLEYKITFGDLLRNTLTFGKRKGIHVKYVCIKE